MSKLNAEAVADVVARYRAGEPLRDIAARYGVAVSAVSYHAAKHTVLRRDEPIGVACGTRKGYQRHRAAGQAPCSDCREANAREGREWLARRREVV